MFPDAPCNFYPRHKGHPVVNNGNVRPFFNSPSDRLVALACLSNDLPAGAPFQHGTQPRSHRFVLARYKNPVHDAKKLQSRTASGIDISASCRSPPNFLGSPTFLQHFEQLALSMLPCNGSVMSQMA